jgi:hypothetical protein
MPDRTHQKLTCVGQYLYLHFRTPCVLLASGTSNVTKATLYISALNTSKLLNTKQDSTDNCGRDQFILIKFH